MEAAVSERNKKVATEASILAALFRIQQGAERVGCFRRPAGGSMPMDSATSDFEAMCAFARLGVLCCAATVASVWASVILPIHLPVWAAAAVSLPLALAALLLSAVRVALSGVTNGIFKPCYDLVLDGQKLTPPPASSAGSEHAERAAWELTVTQDEGARESCALRVRFAESGRLGNWLLQYAAARVRALALDVRFESPDGVLGRPFDALPLVVGRWQLAAGAEREEGGGPPPPLQRHHVLLRPRCQGPRSPLPPSDAELLDAYTGPGSLAGAASLTAARALHGALGSHFSSAIVPSLLAQPAVDFVTDAGLFVGAEAQVRSWMAPCLLPPPRRRWDWGASDVAVHVRLGDILHCHHAAYRPLPMSFYRDALSAVAERLQRLTGPCDGAAPPPPPPRLIGRVLLVTEDPRHPIIERMRARLCEWGYDARAGVDGGGPSSIADDLGLLASAPALVLSLSSFAWWPAFAGIAKTVVVPRAGFMLPHVWRPSRASPVTLMHDLTIRDGDDCAAAGVAAPPPASDGETAAALAVTQAAATALAGRLAGHRRVLADHWAATGALGDSSARGENSDGSCSTSSGTTYFPRTGPVPESVLAPSKRVVYVSAERLDARPWRAGQPFALENLFDA